MDTEAYERALKALREEEYNKIYKANLCFVCSNSLERPCFICHNIRFTQKAVCLQCVEGLDVRREEEGGKPCANCSRVIDRLCVMCDVVKPLTVPVCLRCCGELSEGEDDREEDNYGHLREKNTIVVDEKDFKLCTILAYTEWNNLDDCRALDDVDAWLGIIDLFQVMVHYAWEHNIADATEEQREGAKVSYTYPFPRMTCKDCIGDCVCFDPDDYPELQAEADSIKVIFDNM